MKYGIAIFPSKPVQDKANALRKRYDPHYALIPPHITLKEAFEADDDTIHKLVSELRAIAKETAPIKININKVSTFAPVTNTIYMKVEATKEIVDLFEKMQSGRFPANKEYSFVPHITVAQKLSDQEYADVYGSLTMKDIQLEDKVDRFQLLYQLENGSWTVYESFVFGKDE
ncbi:YjcG family protein [Virgibacillus flavescens]|uniref:YjcG family protein n=1 Tax=Virgibacillus flavescens TaxID=1611422 RepID=UPI003D3495DD